MQSELFFRSPEVQGPVALTSERGIVSVSSFSIRVPGLGQSSCDVLMERCLYFGGIINSREYFSKEPFSLVPHEPIPALVQSELPLTDMPTSILLLSIYRVSLGKREG